MSSSLSDISASRGFCFGLTTAWRGVETSWQRSAVKGRISSYRYHCRLASSPFGWMTGGIVTSSGDFLRARDCSRNGLSTNSWRRTVVDPSAKWKWWNFLMFATLRKNVPRNVVHLNVGTITSPLSVPHSWATFTSDDCSTTVTISWRQSTFVFRYSRFTSPKHQSQLNLVLPVSRNDRVMSLWRPVSTRHIKYCIMHEFLFWPLQLSACKWTPHSPTP